MSHRSSFSQGYGGGRASPYAAAPRLSHQDRSFSELFEYVGPSESGSRVYEEITPVIPMEDDDAPDVIHVKYMGQAFTLKFPAYSISESGVTVQEVRRRIADGLQQDSRRVRLVYKDRELKFDPSPIKKYGLKQNSEIAVVVTEQLNDYGGTDSHHSSGDDSGSGSKQSKGGRRPRGLSTVRHRSEDISTSAKTKSSPKSSGFLHPNGHSHYENRDETRRSVSPGRSREPTHRSSEKVPDQPRRSASPLPRSASADPNSALGKVQALQDEYYDKWLPESQQFLRSPPSDLTQRDKDYKRLSECIMKHVIMAADAIELQGDQEARVERKKVLVEAQETLRKLDAISKAK